MIFMITIPPTTSEISVIVNLLDIDRAEIIILVSFQLVTDPHRHHALIERSVERLAVTRLAVNLDAVKPPEDTAIRRDRNVGEFIERVTEHRPSLLLDADDAHGEARNLDGPADGIEPGKELFADFISDYDNQSGRVHIRRPYEPPVGYRLIFDVGDVGRNSRDVGSGEFLPVLFDIDVMGDFCTHFLAKRAVFEDPLEIVKGEPFVPAIAEFPLLFAQRPYIGHSRNHEMIHAKHPGYAIDHISVQAADRRAHNHNRGNTDNDA